MDPNATLAEIREILTSREGDDRLEQLIASLDQWLSTGGFLPEDWEGRWNEGVFVGREA